MKFVVFMVVVALCLSNCGLLRNSSKSSNEVLYKKLGQSDLKYIKQKEVSEELNVVANFKDSLIQDYEIQIWPKGNFSFSKDLRFVGEAEKVQIKGRANRLKEHNKTFNNQLKINTKQVLEDQHNRKEVLTQKESSKQTRPSWKWIAIFSILIVVGFACIKKKIKY